MKAWGEPRTLQQHRPREGVMPRTLLGRVARNIQRLEARGLNALQWRARCRPRKDCAVKNAKSRDGWEDGGGKPTWTWRETKKWIQIRLQVIPGLCSYSRHNNTVRRCAHRGYLSGAFTLQTHTAPAHRLPRTAMHVQVQDQNDP